LTLLEAHVIEAHVIDVRIRCISKKN